MSLTVLFSSAGRRVELMNCFREDAAALGVPLRVLAVDSNPRMSAACQAADRSFAVPRCLDDEFLPRMHALCAEQQVDLVVPTIDTELPGLARAREMFRRAGTRVVVSNEPVVAMARDKLRTARFLAEHAICSPRTVPLAELLADESVLEFPVILKRIDGSSSIGLYEARTPEEVRRLALESARYVAQEKWIGREYTVNVFFDSGGRLRAAVPHLRCETRGGEVSKGRTERVPALHELALRLGEKLEGATGALCFQSIVRPDGTAMIFEINARFGGGYPLAHRAGARFSQWLIEEAVGRPATAHDEWEEGLAMLRYDAALFSRGEDGR